MFQGGTSEVDREENRLDSQEENYSFVWGKQQPGHQSTPGASQYSVICTLFGLHVSKVKHCHIKIICDICVCVICLPPGYLKPIKCHQVYYCKSVHFCLFV